MRFAVLSSGDGWHVEDLARAARQMGHKVDRVSFRHLEASVGRPNAELSSQATPQADPAQRINLLDADAVIVRTMPAGSLEQVVFRMDVLHRLVVGGLRVFNTPRALETAIDKYLTCVRLEAAALPVPETIVCESSEDACGAFERLGGDVVLKPIFGSEGRGLTRVSDIDVAWRVFRSLERTGSILYLQRFIAHAGFDLRVMVLDGHILTAMRRRHAADWRTNVARGAKGELIQPSQREAELAIEAAQAVDAEIAGVDLLQGLDGKLYVLEVNAVPGWRALQRVTGVDVAREILTYLMRPSAAPRNCETTAHATVDR